MCVFVHVLAWLFTLGFEYGVALVSRIDQVIGLFC